jgi:hypothetical protein
MANFEPPTLTSTSTLTLIEDQDEPGRKAVAKAAARFTALGYRIRIARPLQGKDVNDALLALGLDQPLCSIEDYHPQPCRFSEDDLADTSGRVVAQAECVPAT